MIRYCIKDLHYIHISLQPQQQRMTKAANGTVLCRKFVFFLVIFHIFSALFQNFFRSVIFKALIAVQKYKKQSTQWTTRQYQITNSKG